MFIRAFKGVIAAAPYLVQGGENTGRSAALSAPILGWRADSPRIAAVEQQSE